MFGISLLADDYPDPDFRMPDKPDFHIAPSGIMEATVTPEDRYWVSKAAASGSSRANLIMGINYMDLQERHLLNPTAGLDFLKQALSQGNVVATNALSIYLDPRFVEIAAPKLIASKPCIIKHLQK